MNNIVYKNSNECTWIEKYSDSTNKKKNYFSFCDAIFIITVKKNETTDSQLHMVKNIDKLGCKNNTYWCYTKGYKECNLKDHLENLKYNYKIIFEFCILKNFDNILILEDDLIVTDKLWDNYKEKKKEILNIIIKNKNKCLIFYFGKLPFFSYPVNKYISKGLFIHNHCVMFNQNSAKEFLKLYNNIIFHANDTFQLLNNTFKCYSLLPDNIFFQKSDKRYNFLKKYGHYLILVYIQSLFTGRIYYQYDPRARKYWEPYGFTWYSFLILFKVIILVTYIFLIIIKKLIKK